MIDYARENLWLIFCALYTAWACYRQVFHGSLAPKTDAHGFPVPSRIPPTPALRRNENPRIARADCTYCGSRLSSVLCRACGAPADPDQYASLPPPPPPPPPRAPDRYWVGPR